MRTCEVLASLSFAVAIACGTTSDPDDDDVGGTDVADARCGNALVEAGEECDNGGSNNNFVPNACRIDCTNPLCGDGVVDDTEECDLGPENGGEICDAFCVSLVEDGTTTTGDASTTAVDMSSGTSSSTADPTTSGTSSTGDVTTGDMTTSGTTTGDMTTTGTTGTTGTTAAT